MKLHFHHSPAVAGDSNLEITISTEGQGGTRRQGDGSITLVGNATFQGGYLGGNTCHLVIAGTLQPGPLRAPDCLFQTIVRKDFLRYCLRALLSARVFLAMTASGS